MACGPDDFDLATAWYRKAQGDLRAFIEAFAVRLEGALPGRVAVERRRDHLFSSTSHVVKVTIASDPNVYALCLEGNRLSAQRAKAVRGVTLKSETMDFPDWLTALNGDVQRLAEQANAAHSILHDFLTS